MSDSQTKVRTVAQEIAAAAGARKRCLEDPTREKWLDKWTEALHDIECELPHGSGIDSGTVIDFNASGDDKIVLLASYHHMNDAGFYDGWTDHILVITPAFDGLRIQVQGHDRNGIKEYLHEVFREALSAEWGI
jgi:hypothetical protein